ncbi:putative NUDIX domain containing protein [Lyophyllum shimeji]|uniref:NUDIX domain containing protein n=1 Tax=Lyophyllum shimeji TaxID=47721 RepID=A0A9P3PVP3_LYOSH|nr:putative NUDIX domain containing protein [Lyophyllum shimeji]
MSIPRYPTKQYLAGEFVISAGSVLFRHNSTSSISSGLEICLIHNLDRDEWLLPKGRKDRGESLAGAAVRETFEETGYPCALWPQRMPTRAPVPGVNDEADLVAVADGLVEPVGVTIRELPAGRGVKIIWWYVTLVTGEPRVEGTLAEYEAYEPHFLEPDGAIARLTFQNDRELVQKAWDIVAGNTVL